MKHTLNITKGEKIKLSVKSGISSPRVFSILQITSKAIYLKSAVGNTIWIPMTSFNWDPSWECFSLKEWFIKRMSAVQFSALK